MSDARPTGSALHQYEQGWDIDSILGAFGSKLVPLKLLGTLTQEAYSKVPDAALPVDADLAGALVDLDTEYRALCFAVMRYVSEGRVEV